MQYGELITRAFSIVWRHKYLWLLAILGGADVGTGGGLGGNFSGGGNSVNGGGLPSGPGPHGDAASALGHFLQDKVGLIVLVGLLVVVVVVAWWLLSCVTIGALVRATAEH